MIKTQLKFIITIVLVLGFSISLQSLIASWQAPSNNPPSPNNIPRPINVGLAEQTKSGNFILGSDLLVAGTSTVSGKLLVSDSIDSLGAGMVFNGGNFGMEFNIDADGSGGDDFVYKVHGVERMRINSSGDISIAGDIIANNIVGDGSGLTGIQPLLTQSCAVGSSIRKINSDGSVVCELDDGAANSFTNCFYDGDSICPSNTLMRGLNGGQAYCCGSGSVSCTATSWATYDTYCTALCNTYDCGTRYGNIMNRQRKTLSNCLIETRIIDSGTNCSQNCRNLHPEMCEGSTPYLFTNIASNYLIENDVMATFWETDYTLSKDMYENAPLDKNGFAENKYRGTDEYILANNPSIEDGIIKLRIEEIEPEESYPDQFKLARIMHGEDTELIIDNQSNKLRSIIKTEEKNIVSNCEFINENGDSSDCLDSTKNKDNLNIHGRPGAKVEFEIDITKFGNKDVYLVVNSWGSNPLPMNPEYLKASSNSLLPTFFDVEGDGEYVSFNHIHPREIQTDAHLDITEVIKMAKNNTLGIKIDWTDEHWVDQISIVTSEEKEYRLEELLLVKANHSRDNNVLDSLLEKDQKYAHTIQKDIINLEFSAGRYIKYENEKESYVFISSGFYTALRESLYPELEVDHDWQERIDGYVEELNNLE